MIDYVLIVPGEDPNAVESLIRELKPAQFFRLDEEDLSRRGELDGLMSEAGKSVSFAS